jgi:hypothetical protein
MGYGGLSQCLIYLEQMMLTRDDRQKRCLQRTKELRIYDIRHY